MKRNIPSPVDLKVLDLVIIKTFFVQLQVIFTAALPQGENRWMFAEQEIMLLRFRVTCPFISYQLLMELGLQFPCILVGDAPKIDDTDGLYRKFRHAAKIHRSTDRQWPN